MVAFSEIESGVILVAKAGSVAYGTSLPHSDLDFRGIFIAPLRYKIGLQTLEKYETLTWDEHSSKFTYIPQGSDVALYEIQKYLGLVEKQNPNILELLWVSSEDIIYSSPIYWALREYREALLSKTAYHSFIGYCVSQYHRLKKHKEWLDKEREGKVATAPIWSDFSKEDEPLPKAHLYAFYSVLRAILRDSGVYYKQYMDFENFLDGIDFKGLMIQKGIPEDVLLETQYLTKASKQFIQQVSATQQYHKAMNQYQSWQQWKQNRNKVRKDLEEKVGYDCKHGMHCIRLLQNIVEILSCKKLTVRQPNAQYLKKIRTGEVGYEEWEEVYNNLLIDARKAYDKSTLPDSINSSFVERLLLDSVYSHLGLLSV